MGNKKEKVKVYMSKEGRQGRKQGMYKQEKRCTKIMYFIIFSMAAVIFLVIGAIHASRADNARRINDDYN